MTQSINTPKKLEPSKCDHYLKMLAQAMGYLSRNNGAQRKDIWQYVMNNFPEANYQTFLLAINQLISNGKIIRNEYGFYFVEK